jgi:hypothetical protein
LCSATTSRGVAVQVQRCGLAHELAVDEYTRPELGIGRMATQLDPLARQVERDLEHATMELHRAVGPHLASLASQEHLGDVEALGQRTMVRDLGQKVLERSAAGRRVWTRMVLGAEPGPVLGVERLKRQRLGGQLVAHLLTPRAMPSFDGALGLAVARLGVQQVDAKLGAAQRQRLGHVCGAAIDVVGARPAVHA